MHDTDIIEHYAPTFTQPEPTVTESTVEQQEYPDLIVFYVPQFT